MESSTERDHRVMTILAKALRQPPAERESYVRLACENETDLRQEVAETVAWEERWATSCCSPWSLSRISLARFKPDRSSRSVSRLCVKSAMGEWALYTRLSTESANNGSRSKRPNLVSSVCCLPSLKARSMCGTQTSAW